MSKNTLGAPTEGLGQTVTFANGGSSSVPQLQAGELSSARTGQRGGSGAARISSQPLAIPDAREGQRILDVVQRFGDNVLQPKIEQEKNLAFVNGMHRVAAGEAVKEIVEEQPWYSSLFGDTPVVEGARTFASFSRVQKEMLDIETQMPELRKLAPAEFQKQLSGRLTSITEGDDGTDAMMAQQFIKEMPNILKAHTKEHLGYQQQQFAEQARNAQLVAASRLSATISGYDPAARDTDILMGNYGPSTYKNENDVLEAKISFAQAFAPVPGIPEETYQKMTTGVVQGLLSDRNLHAFYTLEDAGVVDGLGPENSKRIRDYADRIEARVRADMPVELVDRLAVVKAMPSLYDREGINDDLKLAVDRLNADYMRATGAREPLLSGNTAAELQASLFTRQEEAARRAQEAAAKARDRNLTDVEKQAEAQRAVAETVFMLAEGSPAARRMDTKTTDAAWDYLRTDPAKLAQARVNSIEVSTDVIGQISIRSRIRALKDAEPNQENLNAIDNLYRTEYLPMVQANGGNVSVANAYFGLQDGGAELMQRYHERAKYMPDPRKDPNAVIGLTAALIDAKADRTPFATGKDSLDQRGLKAVGSATSKWVGTDLVSEPYRENLWRMVKPKVERMSGDMEDNVNAAVNELRMDGVEFMAGYFWQATPGQPNIDNTLADIGSANKAVFKPEERAEAVARTFKARADEVGMTEFEPIFYPGVGGKPQIVLLGVDKDGATKIQVVSPDDIWANEVARRKAKEKSIPAIPGVTGRAVGPKLTFLPKEGARSIYD